MSAPGDEIVISAMEHHSNIVPWQMLCEEKGAKLRVVPINDDGELRPRRVREAADAAHEAGRRWSTSPTRWARSTRSSEIIELAHRRGIPVLVDGAQAVPHLPRRRAGAGLRLLRLLRAQAVRPDRHRRAVRQGAALLEPMPPYQGGGDMIARSPSRRRPTTSCRTSSRPARRTSPAPSAWARPSITSSRSAWRPSPPTRTSCCATPPSRLRQIPGVRIIGTAPHKAGVLSFVVDDPPMSALDVGTKLDLEGVAVRTGHHCCQPVMDRFGMPGTARASFAMYNTTEEIDHFAAALREDRGRGGGQRRGPCRRRRSRPSYRDGRGRRARRRRPTSWPRSSSSSTTGPTATSTSSSWARSCRRCRRR